MKRRPPRSPFDLNKFRNFCTEKNRYGLHVLTGVQKAHNAHWDSTFSMRKKSLVKFLGLSRAYYKNLPQIGPQFKLIYEAHMDLFTGLTKDPNLKYICFLILLEFINRFMIPFL